MPHRTEITYSHERKHKTRDFLVLHNFCRSQNWIINDNCSARRDTRGSVEWRTNAIWLLCDALFHFWNKFVYYTKNVWINVVCHVSCHFLLNLTATFLGYFVFKYHIQDSVEVTRLSGFTVQDKWQTNIHLNRNTVFIYKYNIFLSLFTNFRQFQLSEDISDISFDRIDLFIDSYFVVEAYIQQKNI